MFGLKRLRKRLNERIDSHYATHRTDHFQLQADIDALAHALKLKRQYKAAVVEYISTKDE